MSEENKKIGIQGLKGSFHHEAAIHFFGHTVSLLECITFKDVIQNVQSGHATHGIMAIENSLAGSIIPNYKLLLDSKLKICGEVGLRVKLYLLAIKGTTLKHIFEIRSHPMALRQCTPFLEKLQSVHVVESFDTAGSAKQIATEKLSGVATVASALAAKEYELHKVVSNIESHELNYTRFLVISKPSNNQVGDPNKVSIYFETKDEPGALSKLLTIVSGLNINLGKLQSYPIPSKNTHYGFFATLEMVDIKQLNSLEILLKAMTVYHEILGIYRKGKIFD